MNRTALGYCNAGVRVFVYLHVCNLVSPHNFIKCRLIDTNLRKGHKGQLAPCCRALVPWLKNPIMVAVELLRLKKIEHLLLGSGGGGGETKIKDPVVGATWLGFHLSARCLQTWHTCTFPRERQCRPSLSSTFHLKA